MKLLLLLNGYKEDVFGAHKLDPNEFETVKIDDKDLAKPKTIVNLIKRKNYERIYFGCRELKLQRFQTFMKIYSFLGGKKTSIIDELGGDNRYSFAKLLFAEAPALAFEIIASGFAVAYYRVKFPIDKKILTGGK